MTNITLCAENSPGSLPLNGELNDCVFQEGWVKFQEVDAQGDWCPMFMGYFCNNGDK